ncbi:hypothetical protein AWC22_12810 [Mycobacterium riyadhense]|uniref:DUF5631 domain-containing protein n=2 Tax=Mycobacterium riyadhense TaxID=486698 RepID=A0A1X2D9Y8_9MYCO|nr:hypothetical protein AWC22_12810 [Mycobacterium riyadhense]
MGAINHGKENRGKVGSENDNFADLLRHAQTGPLVDQQGFTADDIRDAFRRWEEHHRRVAEKNGIKKSAYAAAYDSMVCLRQDLTGLADEGNNEIKAIQDSDQPVDTKVTQIVSVIRRHRALANLAAAKYGGNVLDAMQSILDVGGTGQSSRQFSKAHGVDVSQMFRQPDDHRDLEKQVRGMLDNPGSAMGAPPGFNSTGMQPAASGVPPAAAVSGSTFGAPAGFTPATSLAAPPSAPGAPGSTFGAPAGFRPAGPTLLPAPLRPPAPAAPPVSVSPAPSVAGASTPSLPGAPAPPGVGTPSLPGVPASPLSGATVASPTGAAQGMTPASLLQSFDAGMQAGALASAPANALPHPSMEMQPSHVAPSAPTAPMAGAGVPVHAPAFDVPPTPPPAPEAPTASTAAPMIAAPATPSAPATPTPAGPLPAYGADLRPSVTAASTPAVPLSTPTGAASPGSAPVLPASGQGGVGQPAVVRQPGSPTPPPSPSGVGTQAVAATAGGAIAGAASADATARARLKRIVDSVARQQPKLAWAAGDRPDNTTVLVTDLASGWIPPGIDLPAAITLLDPARRRGDLESLLGEVSVTASYSPIHYLPDEDDEPVPTSSRPRRAPDVEELGWELSQATHWRDGLPQLAHTLAKAISRGTGVLDSEVETLRIELAEVTACVLDSYPDHVDAHEVGNWQLLAAIDALVAGDRTTANYHLAWFLACDSSAAKGIAR